MKKLLYLSSFVFLLGFLQLAGCKAKKSANGDTHTTSEKKKKTEKVEEVIIIPSPGVINEDELDSIKDVRNRQKGLERPLYDK